MPRPAAGPAGGTQSLEAALRLLIALAARPGPASLSDLARHCDMQPSTVHRYLTSFQHAGFVEQAGKSGKYDLGHAALELGLSAIARHDFVNRASDRIGDLAAQTGMSVFLSIWGSAGATVIRWERAEMPAVTSMGLGTTLPLLTTATGRAFLAWAPPAPLRAARAAELARARKLPGLVPDLDPSEAGIEALIARIRARGIATVDGTFIPGLAALAAPILDWQGQAQAVATMIGTTPDASDPGSAPAQALRAFCQSQSFAPLTDPAPDPLAQSLKP
ncbi:MAG: helix-turn-helix domain-containing protein [Rhodobacteraceae bacterium]|jgi:DNA-binding IclR family transcriptional regulator|nr:helix-turn-helix domain-containing protein [Paracoccaceae bacterium]